MNHDQHPSPFDPDLEATTTAAGQSVDAGKARIFPCEGCGADLEYHIGQQRLKCPYCGYEKELELPPNLEIIEQDYHATLARIRELHDAGTRQHEGQCEVRCESCGANVVFVGALTSSACAYCGSPIQRDKIHDAPQRIAVDGVLPFLVDEKTAGRNLSDWVKSRWFAPNDFLKQGVHGNFNGVYLPYWTFDSLTYTRFRGERGEHYWVTVGSGKNQRRVRKTSWYPASGEFERFFDDVLVPATRGMQKDMLLTLEPWPLGKCRPFSQEFLAGYQARTYETKLDAGFEEARARIEAALNQDVRSRIGGDDQRIDAMDVLHNALTFKHLLLPLWLLAYRYHDKAYQVVVNASTGEVHGERPYSAAKIALAVLAALAAVGAVMLFQS